MSIKILKLVSGEEIIGDVEYNEKNIIIDTPAKIVLFPTEDQGMGMALMIWLPYSNDEKVTLKQRDIMTKVNPTPEIAKQYSERFGSGIVTPTKEIIV